MADQQRPSDRIIGNVNTNTNNQVGGGVGEIKKYIAGVPPSIEGKKNPDGTYDNFVVQTPQGTKQTESDKQQKQQLVGVFQLLTRYASQILEKLTTLLTRQEQDKKERAEENKKFFLQLEKNLTPTLFEGIDKPKVDNFLDNINTIAKHLSSAAEAQKDFTTSIKNLNTTLSEKFIPSFKDIDVTSAIASKIVGLINVTSAISGLIKGDPINVAEVINSKIKGEFNVTTGFNDYIKGLFDVTSAINSRLCGNFDVTTGFNDYIKGLFNVTDAIDSRLCGSFDISNILPAEELKTQFNTIFDTVNLAVIDTFDASRISQSLQGKIDLIELKFGEIKLPQPEPPSQQKPKEEEEEGKKGVQSGVISVPGNLPTSQDAEKANTPKLDKQTLDLYKQVDELTKRIDNNLITTFSKYLENNKDNGIYLPIVGDDVNSIDKKLENLTKNITDLISKVLDKLDTIDSDLVSIYSDTSDREKEKDLKTQNQLEKINHSIVGDLKEELKAVIAGEKLGEALKEVAVNVKDINTFNKYAEDLVQSDVSKIDKNDNAQIEAFSESVIKYLDAAGKLSEGKEEFADLHQFQQLLTSLQDNFKLDIDIDKLKDRQDITNLVFNNELKGDQLGLLAKVLNRFNHIGAFDTKRDRKDIKLKEGREYLNYNRRLIQRSLMGLVDGMRKSQNPLINRTITGLKKFDFLNNRLLNAEPKISNTAKNINAVVNKPENWSLKNFLTNFGAYNSLEEIINTKVGRRIKALNSLISDLPLGSGKEEGGKSVSLTDVLLPTGQGAPGGKGEAIGKLTNALTDLKNAKGLLGGKTGTILKTVGKGLTNKGIANALGGVLKSKGLLTGGAKVLGLGGKAAAGALGGVSAGTLAAGTAAAVVAAAAGYGAYKAKDWDKEIGNTEGKSRTGSTHVDGALAGLNHFLGEGLWSRVDAAIKYKDWRKLKFTRAEENALDNIYTDALQKALVSLGKDAADELKLKRQTKLIRESLDLLDRKYNTYGEEFQRLGIQYKLLDIQKLKLTGVQSSQLSDSTLNFTNLNQGLLKDLGKTIGQQQTVLKFQSTMNNDAVSYYGTTGFIHALAKENRKTISRDQLWKYARIHDAVMSAPASRSDSALPRSLFLQSAMKTAMEKGSTTIHGVLRKGHNLLKELPEDKLNWLLDRLKSDQKIILKADESYVDYIQGLVGDSSGIDKSDIRAYKRDVLSRVNELVIRAIERLLEMRKTRKVLKQLEAMTKQAAALQNPDQQTQQIVSYIQTNTQSPATGSPEAEVEGKPDYKAILHPLSVFPTIPVLGENANAKQLLVLMKQAQRHLDSVVLK